MYHMMGMVAHLRLPYSFYAHIALPVDVGVIPGQYPGCLGVDRPVYPLAVGEPLLKVHQCRVLVQPLKKGYGSNLSLGPDGNAGESQLLAEVEGAEWSDFFEQLVADGRAARCRTSGGPLLWCAAENWPALQVALPGVEVTPEIVLPDVLQRNVDKDEGRKLLVRGRLEISGRAIEVPSR